MGKIIVYLDKITNLKDTDVLGQSDPYVKFHLEQDNWLMDKNYGRKVSSKKKDELNPVYGETFVWDKTLTLSGVSKSDGLVFFRGPGVAVGRNAVHAPELDR